MDLLNDLNNMQKEAVINVDGPSLIIAGAGSGKTKVLTYKIAYLIKDKNVNPWNILAITFTNKAASEMKQRAQLLVGDAINDMWIGTFHSICVRILRRYIDRLGYEKSFVIFDTSDQKTLVKKCLKELNVDTKLYTEKSVLNEISNAKNEILIPEDYSKKIKGDYRKEVIAKVYSLYQKRLKENNALDFDDIINLTITLLEENDDVLENYSNQFEYILVDEYQDTNKAQFMLISILAKNHGNITAVGDNDQGIYSFRGADITNILHFERDFPGTRIIKLEQNYRCTGNILNAANSVIKHNTNKFEKKLWTENKKGDLPKVYCGDDEYKEANYIINQINNLKKEEEYKFSDFAVLYRMNSQSRAIEDILRREDIPYKIIGGLKFYERKEIKDIIAYLRLIANSNDNISLIRIINEPKRGIGQVSLDKIANIAQENETSMYEIIKKADIYMPRIYENTKGFCECIEKLKKLDLSVPELIKQVLELTQYKKQLEVEDTVESETRIQNLDEFLTVANEFENEAVDKSLNEFLQSISLSSDSDELEDENDVVTLMTLHSAKGLEYKAIFLVGMEDGIFPGYQNISDPISLEEERRLFYVGITRAKEHLFMTFAKRRTIFGSTSYNPPSRFLKEIPENLLDGYDDAINEKKKSNIFENYDYDWNYGRKKPDRYSKSENVISFTDFAERSKKVEEPLKYNYRTAESFLKSIEENNNISVDLSKYKIGQRVGHKKFGEGIITNIEQEDDDLKVDIDFDKAGHKRLMAKFARLEII